MTNSTINILDVNVPALLYHYVFDGNNVPQVSLTSINVVMYSQMSISNDMKTNGR